MVGAHLVWSEQLLYQNDENWLVAILEMMMMYVLQKSSVEKKGVTLRNVSQFSGVESFAYQFKLCHLMKLIVTPLKFNIAPEKFPKPNRKVFQPPFFRGKLAVKLRGGR